MTDPDELARAEAEFNVADINLKKCASGKPGFGAEARYASAYQFLVRLDARPQIKLKYRSGR